MRSRSPHDLSSYLRLARPESAPWWRLVLALVAGVVGFLAVTLIALVAMAGALAVVGRHFVVDTDAITPELLLATNLGLALCIPLAGLLVWSIYGRRPRWLGSVAPGIRRRWLGTCTAIAGVVWGALLVLLLLGVAVSDSSRLDGEAVGFIVVAVLTTPIQAAGEEYLFGGFLLQSLGATRLPVVACWLASGLLFATAHGQFDPPLFADRLLIGVVFAWLATSTGGLEASIALHAVKNVTVIIPAALLGELTGAIEPTGVTWAPVAVDAVMLAIAGRWILSRSRRQAMPPPPPEVLPQGSSSG